LIGCRAGVRGGVQAVEHQHLVAGLAEGLGDMRADEAEPAGDEDTHGAQDKSGSALITAHVRSL
jgi:hypothetical protein